MPYGIMDMKEDDEQLQAIFRDDDKDERMLKAANRYIAAIESEVRMLFLNRKEWFAVFDAMNGIGFNEFKTLNIFMPVEDAEYTRKKWGIDPILLGSQLNGIRYAQKLAVLEVMDMFWDAIETGLSGDQALDAVFEQLGMKPLAEVS